MEPNALAFDFILTSATSLEKQRSLATADRRTAAQNARNTPPAPPSKASENERDPAAFALEPTQTALKRVLQLTEIRQ
jgi:hypothetical protein